MDNNIKVSVIVPVFNSEQYIEECLKSILNQTLKEIEIIIVNDGSTDNSLDVINKINLNNNEKITVISKGNGGQSSARNLGMKHANGEYIGFVDSDDFIDEDMYRILFQEAKSQNLDVVQSSYLNWYASNSKDNYPYKFLPTDSKILSGKEYFQLDPAVGVCDKIFKKSFMKKNGFVFIEGIYAEDALIVPEILFYAEKVKFIKKPLYNYRRASGSTTNPTVIEKKIKLGRDKIYVASKLNEFRKQKNWQGNISRIIVPMIITPFLKKDILNSNYRKQIINEFRKKKSIKILAENLNIKLIIQILRITLHKIGNEKKI